MTASASRALKKKVAEDERTRTVKKGPDNKNSERVKCQCNSIHKEKVQKSMLIVLLSGNLNQINRRFNYASTFIKKSRLLFQRRRRVIRKGALSINL